MMDFSVIVLIYNSDTEDLKLTIDSILQQKGITYQIVLADDASSNNALTEAEEYLREKEFKDYKICSHAENVGTVRNVYDALSVAEGKFVKLIGAGDALFSNFTLRNVYHFMDKKKLDMCFGKMKGYVRTEDGTEYSDIVLPYDIEAFEKNNIKKIRRNILVNHGWIVGASMFVDRTVFMDCLKEFVGKVRYCEDLVQTIFLLRKKSIGYFRGPVVYYENSGGISTSTNSGARKRMYDDVRALKKLLMDNYYDDPLVVKGNKMFVWQLIENDRERQIKIFTGNTNYVRMLLRTKLQRKRYVIRKKGILENESTIR